MSQELVTREQQPNLPAFASRSQMPTSVNAGAVAIEQERAIAEAQGQLILAKKFPRDLNGAHAELMAACKSPAFAAQAFYSVPNRGSGPSIRFAEEVARVYGNFQYGHRELSRGDGKSEVEVFAWDMQNNNRSTRQLTVPHAVDTKNGPKPCRDQAEVDNLIANKASKQIRGRILALMPKWLVADAIEECKKTLAGNNDEPLSVRVRKMTQAFAKYGVTAKHLEAYVGHSLDEVLLDELVDLTGVFNALKEGAAASDYFGAGETAESSAEAAADLAATAKSASNSKPAARKPAAKPQESKPAEEERKPVEEPAAEVTETQSQPETEQSEPEQTADDTSQDDGGDLF
ncbi:hypothetical protein FHR70_000651 [Microvirga lupini]|uniref:Uncharacterized protein n=1 Tax=Microvirga lupini TaxID=420324 RepID=A0A7W4VIW9_9HYPH|nr:hypothetical protein [Microvirga lupini]MBB3017611.1 hypothetical protein [Microvirga lupini]